MEMLLRLTGDLSAVRGRVQELEDQGLAAALEDISTKVGNLRETLAAVVAVVQQIQEGPQEEEEVEDWPGTTPNWRDDLDQEKARVLWDWLIEWCQNTLWPFYAQSVWLPCWYKHPRLRIELTALCANWYWSYQKGAPPTRVMEWHARWWPHVEKVLKEELKNCGLPHDGKKLKHPVPVPAVPTEEDPAPEPPPYTAEDFADPGFLAAVDRDVERRRLPEGAAD